MSETQVSNRYCVRADAVAGYHPANHTGTLNRAGNRRRDAA